MPSDTSQYDPNGPGLRNGNFLGLPVVDAPGVHLLAVGYDATVSYSAGTAAAPARVLEESTQLDVCLPGLDKPWEIGFHWEELRGPWTEHATRDRSHAEGIIDEVERGIPIGMQHQPAIQAIAETQNALASVLQARVSAVIAQGRLPVVIGGDHSTPLGAYRACATTGDFGLLQLDAHFDLREEYEGFEQSHASIMYNALQLPQLRRLVAVGIRDWCPAEQARAQQSAGRIVAHYAHDLHTAKAEGQAFAKTCDAVIRDLPHRVWLSLDVDGLDPAYCPSTGTPVPGGLTFAEVQFLWQRVLASGREIIGIDIVETGDAAYDANVTARLAYELSARAVVANRKLR